MVKEGEGNVQTKKEGKKSSLQNATGQGKETEGIKYPYPAPYVLAFVEDEFGSVEEIANNPQRHAYQMSIMLVFYLEMQKRKRLKEIVVMTKEERKVASVDFFEKEKISMEKFNPYAKAAMEVFGNALGAKTRINK